MIQTKTNKTEGGMKYHRIFTVSLTELVRCELTSAISFSGQNRTITVFKTCIAVYVSKRKKDFPVISVMLPMSCTNLEAELMKETLVVLCGGSSTATSQKGVKSQAQSKVSWWADGILEFTRNSQVKDLIHTLALEYIPK